MLKSLTNMYELNSMPAELCYMITEFCDERLVLSRNDTIKFCNDNKYRENITNQVRGGALHLSINLSRSYTDLEDILDKYNASELFKNVSILNINNVFSIVNKNNDYLIMSKLNNIKNVHTIDFSNNSPYSGDIDFLANAHTVNLRHCDNITDVSCLRNVHTLDLSYCYKIEDVTALKSVHNLNLTNCVNITDVSALGNVHTLNLSGCQGVNDVNALRNVHTLNLSGCKNILDVSALKNVHTLILDNTIVECISMLQCVELSITNCYVKNIKVKQPKHILDLLTDIHTEIQMFDIFFSEFEDKRTYKQYDAVKTIISNRLLECVKLYRQECTSHTINEKIGLLSVFGDSKVEWYSNTTIYMYSVIPPGTRCGFGYEITMECVRQLSEFENCYITNNKGEIILF